MRLKLPFALALLGAFSCCIAQEGSPVASRTPHFHWSVRKAVELPDNVNLANSKDLTPAERDGLIRRMESELRPWMREYGLESDQQLRKVARETRIKLTDLDGDGVPEVILQANDIMAGCGSVNCPVWILKKATNGYKKLLDTRAKDGIGGFELISRS
jgi:hypothetical protein